MVARVIPQVSILKDKCPEIYDTEYYIQSDAYKKTCIERFSVPNPMQNEEILEKALRNAHKYKEYIMPSGKSINVQGYEPFSVFHQDSVE